jgi:hypothetical protein
LLEQSSHILCRPRWVVVVVVMMIMMMLLLLLMSDLTSGSS